MNENEVEVVKLVKEPKRIMVRLDENGNDINDSPVLRNVFITLIQFLETAEVDEDKIWDIHYGYVNGKEIDKGIYIDDYGNQRSIRENVYLYLEGLIEDIDIIRSYVISRNVTMDNAISVFSFMVYCILNDPAVQKIASKSLNEIYEYAAQHGIEDPMQYVAEELS